MSRRYSRPTSIKFRPLAVGLSIILAALVLLIWLFVFRLPKDLELHSQMRLNFVWGSQPTRLVSLIPDRELLILEFPADTAIVAARGYGEYQLTSLWKLADLENQSDLVAESFEQFLAVPVSDWINQPGKCQSAKGVDLKRCLAQVVWPLNRSHSSFSWRERFYLYRQLKKLGLAKLTIINPGNSLAAKKKTLPDGQVRTVFYPELLDSLLNQKFLCPAVISENLQLEIVNTTSHPGLANQAARLATNLGVRVVSTTTSDQQLQGCLLKTTKDHQSSATLDQLTKIFSCDLDLDAGPLPADLQLLLGEAYWQKWRGSPY